MRKRKLEPATQTELTQWLTQEGGGWYPMETLGEKPLKKLTLSEFKEIYQQRKKVRNPISLSKEMKSLENFFVPQSSKWAGISS